MLCVMLQFRHGGQHKEARKKEIQVDASHQASQGVTVEESVLEYGRDRPSLPRIPRISGWIALASAALFQPLDMSQQFTPVGSGVALFLAFACGVYGAVASRGRSIPAWGALAAIVVNFISAAIYFNA
jgi:hypothetical protein